MNIYLIEKNLNLIKEQKNNLSKYNSTPYKINWLNNFNIKNKKPVIVIANEFFDCLPIRQFYKKEDKWFEKMVKIKNDLNSLIFKDSEVKETKTLNKIRQYAPNKILEFSIKREKYFNKICQHIKKFGGMMIIIDYGYYKRPNNFTLQSIYNNKKSNVLENIGSQDITSLIDFKTFINLAKLKKLNIQIYSTQREFLIGYGIQERAKKNFTICSNSQKKIITKGLKRIIDKKNMGSLFKVLVISK